MDWEFVGERIASIGNMIAGSIMQKYQQEQEEQRFFKRFEETLRLQEPYKIAENERLIGRMKEEAKIWLDKNKEHTMFKNEYAHKVEANFGSDAMIKKRESILKARKPIDMLWVAQLDRIGAKTRKYEDLTPDEGQFIEYIDDPIVRSTFYDLQFKKKQHDEKKRMDDLEHRTKLEAWEAQIRSNSLAYEKNQELLESIRTDKGMTEANELVKDAKARLKEENKIQLALSQPNIQLGGTVDKEAKGRLRNIEKAQDILTRIEAKISKNKPLSDNDMAILQSLATAKMDDLRSGEAAKQARLEGGELIGEAEEERDKFGHYVGEQKIDRDGKLQEYIGNNMWIPVQVPKQPKSEFAPLLQE